MIEKLVQYVNVQALAITLLASVGLFLAVIWIARKATGREIRDLIALRVAAIVLMVVAAPLIVFFWPALRSPDRDTHALAFWIAELVFGALALFVTWYFNKLLRRRRRAKRERLDG